MKKSLIADDDQHKLARVVLNSLNVVRSKYRNKFNSELAIPTDIRKHRNVVKEMWARWCKNVDRDELRSFTESEYDSMAKLAMWTTVKNHELAGTVPPTETINEWAICHQAQGVRSVKDLGIIT